MKTYVPLLLAASCAAIAADRATVRVDLASAEGPLRPIWRYFGYDEPNFTYMKYGQLLLKELAQSSPKPVYIRTHNLLTSGDGTPALKWGSTNAYTEDSSGRPVYHWTIMDRIFDAIIEAGCKPLVEIGFMPEALSVKPQPYRHTWPHGTLWTGWAYPPKDYHRWAELIHRWVRHSVERYGAEEVATWYWEVWNEPDIGYWQGTPEEYFKLYDFTADAVKRALPAARIGGPHSTGPARPQSADFLRRFLEHCARGRNFVTGKTGSPLDYVGFHAKGRPVVEQGRVLMGLQKNLQDIANGFDIVASFPELRHLPVILGECDPEGCAACSARVYPQNAYRNGPLYASYVVTVLKHIFTLAARHGTNIEAMLTWAFEFEDQPYFDGFRTLATNGVSKPVLNSFRMMGLMEPERVKAESSGAVSVDQILEKGVREQASVDALASRSGNAASVLLWNYHDDEAPGPDASVELTVEGIPGSERRVLVGHYRIDRHHSNAYTVWQTMGSPQQPSPEQYARLQAAGKLELLESPQWIPVSTGRLRLDAALPRQGVSLFTFRW